MIAVAVAVLVAPPLCAETASVSPGQTQLNDEGFEAVAAGDLDKAARLFRASLDLGELNITWLNLGRTLSKLGRCKEANDAYTKTLTAPQVASPSPVEIDAIVARYRLEMRETCGGFLALECSPVDTMVSIDGAEPIPCPADAMDLSAGRHEIIASFDGQSTTAHIDVNGMETTRLALKITPEKKPAPVVTKAPPEAAGSTSWLGWSLMGAGALTIGAGVFIEQTQLLPDIERLERSDGVDSRDEFNALKKDTEELQTITLAVYGSGIALLGAGIIAVLLDTPEDAPVEAFVIPSGGGLTWRATF
jgi:hypothetical protein